MKSSPRWNASPSRPPGGIPALSAIRAERARRSLAEFVRQGWSQVDPAPLVWGWHLDAICEHLQAVSRGQIRQLLIEVPPGHAKSRVASVLWPCWDWIEHADRAWMTASYSGDLSIRDAVTSRTLLETEWYRTSFIPDDEEDPRHWKFASDQNVKSYYRNTKLGTRQALSVAGAGTGWRGNVLVVDDALNAEDAHSEVERLRSIRWFTETMSSRFNDMATAIRVVIGQRLHEGDLTGYLKGQGGWETLCLPSEFDPARRCRTSIGWVDPRQEEGELLFPAKFPREVIDQAKKPGVGMGEYAFAAQHQQQPAPASGGVFKRSWWRFWRWEDEDDVAGLEERTLVIPRGQVFDDYSLSADCTFKKSTDSDLVAIGAWGALGPRKLLLDLEWERMGYRDTKAALKAMIERAPQTPDAILVEDKANGSAIIEEMKEDFSGVVAIEPEGGKVARAWATQGTMEAGDIHLPLHAKWRQSYEDEHASFPKGKNDDAVDQQSQYLNWFRNRGGYVVVG